METQVTNGVDSKMSEIDFSELFETPSSEKEEQKSDEVISNNKTTNVQKSKPIPIWVATKKNNVVIPQVTTPLVCEFLKGMGYGELNEVEFIKRGKDNILSLVNVKKVSKFIYHYFKHLDEKVFQDENQYGVVKGVKPIKNDEGEDIGYVDVYFTKREVEDAIIRYKWFSEKDTIYLNEYTDDKSELDDDEIHLFTPTFRDTDKEVYTFFKNGVVKTTSDGSTIIPTESITDGYIWETSIRNQIDKIEVDENRVGIFEEFVKHAMMYRDKDGKWKLDEKEYESFRTVYGYMLSNYNNNGDTPCPLFVDRDSDGHHAEGGNGKSLIMGSVREWKSTTPINGKNIDVKDKFLFSGVGLDTEFVFMDDVNSDFNFKTVYNYTTSDMEIERKFKDRFVIDKNHKPKIGVATNYILPDTDYSTMRRQYIIEFGSFWHDKMKNENISPQTFFNGKRFFEKDESLFSKKDWLDFFNFGFRCIQEYLTKGVVENVHQNYRYKQLISQIEGVGVNDGVCDWIVKYVLNNQSKLSNPNGIELSSFIDEFKSWASEDVLDKWIVDGKDTRLKKSLYQVCVSKKWEYNPHKQGNTLSHKRWLMGSKNNQVEMVRIVIPRK